jgi:lipopolysaccharide transport system ATP-binding protein
MCSDGRGRIMSSQVMAVQGLGKAYRSYRSEWQRVAGWFGLKTRPATEHWALRGVSFGVNAGEAVGIVGANGAGKSTLLKLITGTLRPTEGRVGVNGRIAAILELGMGFNPEFTARQNVRHAAGLMGFEAARIEQAMAEIEAFAEVGEHFDQPMRTFSSGMQMRVAFAVATAFRPEVLIVDEALAVGDAYFQHKSFQRIRQFREQGTTLLIVSHDRSAVQSLCDRAILLDAGIMVRDGDPESVLDYYNALIAPGAVDQVADEAGKLATRSGTGECTVEDIALLDAEGRPVEIVNVGAPVELRVRVRVRQAVPRLVLGYVIKDRLGQHIYGTNTHHTLQAIESPAAGALLTYRCRFPMNFGPGSYSVATALVSTDTHLVNNYEWRDLALMFSVANLDKPVFVGSAWVPPVISIEAA